MPVLSKARQNQIDQEVARVLLQTNMSYPEDSLLDIVRGLGIDVYDYDFGENANTISGAVNPGIKDSRVEIFLNAKHPPKRKTFTLAHELGHYVLHDHNKKRLRIDQYEYGINTEEAREETEANYFAASLLMPKERFLDVYAKANGNASLVAGFFGVSESAAMNRLRWLESN